MFQLLFWDNKEEINNLNEQIPLMDCKENVATNKVTTVEENNMKHVEEDIQQLHENMCKAAEGTLKPRDEVKREFVRSAATEQLFKDRQQMKEEGKFDEANKNH